MNLPSGRDVRTNPPAIRPVNLIGGAMRRENSGANGTWSAALMSPERRTHYAVDGRYHFFTDALERTVFVEGELTLVDSATALGKRNSPVQRKAGGDHRLAHDDGGHLIASHSSGPGERINLTAMERDQNRPTDERVDSLLELLKRKGFPEAKAYGPEFLELAASLRTSDMRQWTWWDMEQHLVQALAEGNRVSMAVTIRYEGDGRRPTQFGVTFRIGNGPRTRLIFENDPELAVDPKRRTRLPVTRKSSAD